MRTNIVLDDDLVAEAARLSGIRTKKALVHEALRVFIATKKRKSLLDLAGKIELAPGYDYKALRPAGAAAALHGSIHEPGPPERGQLPAGSHDPERDADLDPEDGGRGGAGS
jgi:hypothetical protein